MDNDEERLRLFDRKTLEVAVLLVLLLKLEEEAIVVGSREARGRETRGRRQEEGHNREGCTARVKGKLEECGCGCG